MESEQLVHQERERQQLKYHPRDLAQYMSSMTVTELEELVDKATHELYQMGREFTPVYPWVFVRVLPKEQQLKSSLWLPEKDQNKVVHEGVVLATWLQNPNRKRDQCPVSVGDHVIFPHWSGAPVNGYTDNYRVVKASDWAMDREGGIVAKVGYYDTTVYQDVMELIESTKNMVAATRKQILEAKYIIVDRAMKSCTLSGR